MDLLLKLLPFYLAEGILVIVYCFIHGVSPWRLFGAYVVGLIAGGAGLTYAVVAVMGDAARYAGWGVLLFTVPTGALVGANVGVGLAEVMGADRQRSTGARRGALWGLLVGAAAGG